MGHRQGRHSSGKHKTLIIIDSRNSVVKPLLTEISRLINHKEVFEWKCGTPKNAVVSIRTTDSYIMKPRNLRSSLFWDVTQHWFVVTDVSGQPIAPIFKGQAVQEETSVTTNPCCITSPKSEDLIYIQSAGFCSGLDVFTVFISYWIRPSELTPYSLVFYLEDGGSEFLLCVRDHVPDYMKS
jgi:hypothetical protein